MSKATAGVLCEVAAERERQDVKWGEQNHPDGTGAWNTERANEDRRACDDAARDGRMTWLHILREEVSEASAEGGGVALRRELVQVAAVAVRWIEAIDRRAGSGTGEKRAARKRRPRSWDYDR